MAVAAVINLGPRLCEFGGQAWTHAQQAAEQASIYWAAAPRDCKEALFFSGSTCIGVQPKYYSPGFGPFSLAWGWLGVGWLIGLLIGLHFWHIVAGLERYAHRAEVIRADMRNPAALTPQTPPGLQLMPPWHAAAYNALQVARDGPQRIVLRRLVEDGEAALELLMAFHGVTKREALATVLGEHIVRANVQQWQL